MPFLLNGCAYGLANWPSQFFDAAMKSLGIYATPLAPFGNCESESVVLKTLRLSLVSRLLLPGRPDNIAGFIISKWVFSFKRESRTPCGKKIVDELRDTRGPRIANGDTKRTVILPTIVVRVCASLHHAEPVGVERMGGFNAGESMRRGGHAPLLSAKATTGNHVPVYEVYLRNNLVRGTARAPAEPQLLCGFRPSPNSSVREDRKLADNFSGKVLASKGDGRINFTSVRRSNLSLDVSAGRKLDLPFSTPTFVGNN